MKRGGHERLRSVRGECGNLYPILHLTHTSHTSADVVCTSCRAHLIILPTHPRWLKVTLKRDICCTCVHSTLLYVCHFSSFSFVSLPSPLFFGSLSFHSFRLSRFTLFCVSLSSLFFLCLSFFPLFLCLSFFFVSLSLPFFFVCLSLPPFFCLSLFFCVSLSCFLCLSLFPFSFFVSLFSFFVSLSYPFFVSLSPLLLCLSLHFFLCLSLLWFNTYLVKRTCPHCAH